MKDQHGNELQLGKVQLKYHAEIGITCWSTAVDGWEQFTTEQRQQKQQDVITSLDFLIRHTRNFFSVPFQTAIEQMDDLTLPIPDTAHAIRYSTYEDMHGMSVGEALTNMGYHVYYVEYHSLYDQCWVVVDQLRFPLNERISTIDDEGQRQRLVGAAKQFVEKAQKAQRVGDSMESFIRSGVIKIIQPNSGMGCR